ncbi:MAG TPA: CPBP family intramembrane glutamic endopeptidase [Planctomycetota bacterium]
MDAPPPVDSHACGSCGEFLKPDSRFCVRCGHRRGDPVSAAPAPPSPQDIALKTQAGLKDIKFVLVFYLCLLGCQALSALVYAGSESQFASLVAGTLLMSAVTLTGTARRPGMVSPLYRRPGFPVWGYLLVLVASFPIYFGVNAFVETLGWAFGIKIPRFLEAFEGRGLGWAFALGAVAPALFEELGFRGLVFGLLRRRLSVSEAFLISSAAFAILHLSIPSLATHVPLGLYLCWLRHRSDSLHPPMFAHALHNSWVILAETLSG